MNITFYYGRNTPNDPFHETDTASHPDLRVDCSDVVWTFGQLEIVFFDKAGGELSHQWASSHQRVTGWDWGVRDYSLRPTIVADDSGQCFLIKVTRADGTTTYYSDFIIED